MTDTTEEASLKLSLEAAALPRRRNILPRLDNRKLSAEDKNWMDTVDDWDTPDVWARLHAMAHTHSDSCQCVACMPCTHGCQCEFCREDEPEEPRAEAQEAAGSDDVEFVVCWPGWPASPPEDKPEEVHQPSDEINMSWTGVFQVNGFTITNGTPNMTFEQLGERGKRPDQTNAEAQETGETSEQPLAVCWASAKGSPLWSDPQPPVAAGGDPVPGWYQRATEAHQAAGTALAAGADPIKAMDEYARQAREQNHANAMLQAGQNALPAAQHPSEVQMLTDDLNAVTRERDAAIAEMGRLEKERDIARSDNVLLRLELTGARLMAATLMGTTQQPSPGIPLRALGGTHAATGLKMGERG